LKSKLNFGVKEKGKREKKKIERKKEEKRRLDFADQKDFQIL
jgi:hypothetical protein